MFIVIAVIALLVAIAAVLIGLDYFRERLALHHWRVDNALTKPLPHFLRRR